MGGMIHRVRQAIFAPRERYIRPHNYSLVTGAAGALMCLAGVARQRTPVRSFAVQSSLANTNTIHVGDTHTSLINGIELDPGAAWLFGVDTEFRLSGLMPTPAAFAEYMQLDKQRAAGRPQDTDIEIYLDIADFFCAANDANQRVNVFWSTITK
jgi:hypothetical protein